MDKKIDGAAKKKRSQRKWEKANVFGILSFSVILGIMGVVSFALPKDTISEIEKRELAKMPDFSASALFSGAYTKDIEAFYADTFPSRENFVRLGAMMKSVRGIKYDDITIHETAPAVDHSEIPSDEGNQKDTTGNKKPEQSQPEQKEVAGQKVGSLYVYKNAAMEPFSYNNYSGKAYADVINAYHKELGEDVKIYNLIIPTSAEFNLPDKYKSANASQKESMEYIYSCLDAGITGVDAYSNIAKHTDEYLYFRSDHHWTVNAAYYAYEAFAKAAGFTPAKLEDMEKRTIPEFLGTLYASTQDEGIRKHPDFVDYYIPTTQYQATVRMKNQPFYDYAFDLFGEYAKGANSYSVFLQGDLPLIHVHSSNENGRSIVMVKESFGNAFAPFLVNSYEDVYVVDQRYFQTSLIELIRQNEIDELLFINNAFAANTGIRINEIGRIMYQQFVPPPIEEETEDGEEAQETDDTKLEEEEKETEREDREDEEEEESRKERRERLTGTVDKD